MKNRIVRSVLILAYITGLGLATMVNAAPDHHTASAPILEQNAR